MNEVTDFGWEYVWHCHLLGHEENDMMRPIKYTVSPFVPTALRRPTRIPGALPTPALSAGQAGLDARLRDLPEDDELRRSAGHGRGVHAERHDVRPAADAADGADDHADPTFTDKTVANGTQYWYEVRAENSVGYSAWSASATVTTAAGLNVTASSATITYGRLSRRSRPATPGHPAPGAVADFHGAGLHHDLHAGSPVGHLPDHLHGPRVPIRHYLFITYFQGLITVTPAPLTITAPSGTYPFGGPVPALAPTYTGFVNGDTPASLTGTVTCTPTFTTTTAAGTYLTTCSGATSTNYTITYVPGSVTVTPVALVITASSVISTDGLRRSPVPLIIPSYAGLVPVTLRRRRHQPARRRPSSPRRRARTLSSCSGAVDPNYTITYVPGVVHVTQAALAIPRQTARWSTAARRSHADDLRRLRQR